MNERILGRFGKAVGEQSKKTGKDSRFLEVTGKRSNQTELRPQRIQLTIINEQISKKNNYLNFIANYSSFLLERYKYTKKRDGFARIICGKFCLYGL